MAQFGKAAVFSRPAAYPEYLEAYSGKTNEELVRLAEDRASLMAEAVLALDSVLKSRGLESAEARSIWMPATAVEPSIANLGSMGARWLAFSIDSMFVTTLVLLILWASTRFGQRIPNFYRGELVWSLLYFIGFEWIMHSTPGKYALGLEVRSTLEGEEHPDLWHTILRETLGRWISSILMLGYLPAIQDPRKQAWSDKLASTIVVNRSTETFLRWAIRAIAVLACVECFYLFQKV